jgi:hypothetical protein
LTGQDAKTPYASKKNMRTELQNLLHSPYYQQVRRNRIIIFSWLIVDDAMADDEEPLDYLLDDPELEQFLRFLSI